MTRRESQNLMIAKHLKKYRSITWMQAEDYGIKRLAARIYDLKKKQIPIQSKLINVGDGVKFARYTLIK